MSALLAKFGQWILKYLVTFILKFLKDHIVAEIKRRHDSEEQDKKDEELKKTYDQAVQNGSAKDIETSTEGRLNG